MGGKRNIRNKAALRKQSRSSAIDASKVIDMEAASESAKDLEKLPLEMEMVKYLQRQGKNHNVDIREEKLKKEQAARDLYNQSLSQPDTSLYATITPPAGYSIIKLYKKPIFEVGGLLKPDLVKVKSDQTGSISYEENRFPYLEVGAVISSNGLDKYFGLDEDTNLNGALVTLKINTNLSKYVLFIDKTEITPNYFDGYISIPNYELESLLCASNSSLFDKYVELAIGKVGNVRVNDKVNSELKSYEDDQTETTEQNPIAGEAVKD